jgi:hypothetical protein
MGPERNFVQQNQTESSSRLAAVWMSLGIAVLFFGVGAVQQYIAVWFQDRGLPHVGKTTLVIVYLFYFMGAFQAHRIVNLLGTRICMMATALAYGLMIIALWSGSELLSYVTAAFAGLMASILWTGQTIVLSRISDSAARSNAVAQGVIQYSLGNCLGSLSLGFLVGQLSYSAPVLAFSLFALVSCVIFSKMPTDPQSVGSAVVSRLPSFHPATLGCAMASFFIRFVYALVISQLPIDLRETMGPEYVGLITSSFFFLPLVLTKPAVVLANVRSIWASAYIGLAVSGVGLSCFLFQKSSYNLSLGALLVGSGAAILYPVATLFPRWIADTHSIDVARIAGTYSLMNSSGILVGLLFVTFVSRTNTYIAALAMLMISALSLWMVARTAATRIASPLR